MLSRAIIAYYDPIRQSRRHAAISRHGRLYATPSLCGSTSATNETFPTFTAMTFQTCRQPLRRWVRSPSPVAHRIAVPGFLALEPSRHPQYPASASYTRRDANFGAALFALFYGPPVCQALLTGYDEMKPYALHPAF